MQEQFDIFEVIAYAGIIACVAMVPLILLLEKLGKRKITPIEANVLPDYVAKSGDVVQFYYPHSAKVGTGKVIDLYPAGDQTMVRIAHLDTPSSNRRISSVPEEDLLRVIATESDTKAEEDKIEIMAL